MPRIARRRVFGPFDIDRHEVPAPFDDEVNKARSISWEQGAMGRIDRFTDFWESIRMKTTLDIPDEVYRELKIRAAREGATLTKLIAAALASSLGRPSGKAAPARRLKKREGQKIRDWVDHESAFLEAMRGPVFGEGAVADLLGGRR